MFQSTRMMAAEHSDEFSAQAPPDDAEARPCPRCGAELAFDPARQALGCSHCGYAQPVAPAGPWSVRDAVAERDYAAALRGTLSAASSEERRVVRCDSCGAATTLPERVEADQCPFCAAPLLAPPTRDRAIRPSAVLPFALDERAARDALKRWLGARWFAPSDLASSSRKGRPLQGVYVPFWTFDADTTSDYSGQRGDAYFEHVAVPMQQGGRTVMRRKRIRKIRWRRKTGTVRRAFDDVLILASRSLPPRLARALEGRSWDLFDLKPYTTDFLAGFRAERYAIDVEEGFQAATAVMDLAIRREVRLDIGGDAQRIAWIRTRHSDVTFKHILLPVWIAAYRYRGETYRILVNGRTGEISGERPYDWVKISLAGLLGALIVGAAIALWMSQR